jgi:hypothetical protein
MTAADMDKELGYKNRMRNVGNNLRKFGLLDGESSTLQLYHTDMIDMGLDVIDKKGNRVVCRELGKKYNKSPETIRGDMMIMKRYGVIK